jgi:hypothetical protein
MKTYLCVAFITIVLITGFIAGKHYVNSKHNMEKLKHVVVSKDIHKYVDSLDDKSLDDRLRK